MEERLGRGGGVAGVAGGDAVGSGARVEVVKVARPEEESVAVPRTMLPEERCCR